MATYEDLMTAIIKTQVNIIGPGIAIRLAKEIKELEISYNGTVVSYEGDPVKLIQDLVKIYKKVERGVAITLAKKAIQPILKENPELKVPDDLK
jgi:hypothetical protein